MIILAASFAASSADNGFADVSIPQKNVERYNSYLVHRNAGKNHADAAAAMNLHPTTIQKMISQYNLQRYSVMTKRTNLRPCSLDIYKNEIFNFIRVHQNETKHPVKQHQVKKFIIESNLGGMLLKNKTTNAQRMMVRKFFEKHESDIRNIRCVPRKFDDGITNHCSEINCIGNCIRGDRCVHKRLCLTRFKASLGAEKFKISGKGHGLRLKYPVKKDDFVIEYFGRAVSSEEILKKGSDPYWLMKDGKNSIIDGRVHGNKAKYINHSCQPNCKAWVWPWNGLERVVIVALCSIPAYTELTFDYQWKKTKGDKRTQCLCGSPNCRKWMEK
jgi:hypothetical protein